jgi:hypothetical protein
LPKLKAWISLWVGETWWVKIMSQRKRNAAKPAGCPTRGASVLLAIGVIAVVAQHEPVGPEP